MKQFKFLLMFAILGIVTLSSCERVAPNYYGVLMENYGKNGKSDYTPQQGRVNTATMGTELFQVPAFDQRAGFFNEDGTKIVLHLKASNNTEFTASPLYSYKVMKDRTTDLVFQNARLGSGTSFMSALEENVLEPQIYDLIKEEAGKYMTDSLMANGGNAKFEHKIQTIIKKAFEDKGLELLTFTANLGFSEKVKAKIDSRNEVNTNLTVIDQQIIEQRKKNELASLQAEQNIILSRGITSQLLQQQFIDKWDGKTALYGASSVSLLKTVQ